MFLRLTLCLMVVALGIGLRAQAPTSVPADDDARRATDRIRALEAESDRLTVEARALLADLRTLEAERTLHVARVRESQKAIVDGQAAIEKTAQRLLALEAERVAQLPAVETQLVDMYKRGRTGFARLVFSSGGIREFGRATRAAATMLEVSRERVLTYRATIQALHQERARLETELEARRASETEARQAQSAANKAVAERTAVLARIDAQRDANARLAGELQVEQVRIREEQEAAPPPPPRLAVPEATAAAPARTFGSTEQARGRLLWPVSGRVTGRFGRRLADTSDPAAANGVEIASREGNPVRALHAGTVTFAGQQGAFGNVVIIDHGNETSSVYGYLNSISVAQGNTIANGAELGRVGLAPAGTATLFLEIRIDGRSVDPVQWLRPQ